MSPSVQNRLQCDITHFLLDFAQMHTDADLLSTNLDAKNNVDVGVKGQN